MPDKDNLVIRSYRFNGFFCFIIHSIITHEDKSIKKGIAIDLEVTQTITYKGVVTLNDSIVVDGALPRINPNSISNRYKTFEFLDTPFRIIKKANNDSIIIIKDSETLIYQIFEE